MRVRGQPPRAKRGIRVWPCGWPLALRGLSAECAVIQDPVQAANQGEGIVDAGCGRFFHAPVTVVESAPVGLNVAIPKARIHGGQGFPVGGRVPLDFLLGEAAECPVHRMIRDIQQVVGDGKCPRAKRVMPVRNTA